MLYLVTVCSEIVCGRREADVVPYNVAAFTRVGMSSSGDKVEMNIGAWTLFTVPLNLLGVKRTEWAILDVQQQK